MRPKSSSRDGTTRRAFPRGSKGHGSVDDFVKLQNDDDIEGAGGPPEDINETVGDLNFEELQHQ